MRCTSWRKGFGMLRWAVPAMVVFAGIGPAGVESRLAAAPINPAVYKREFEDARKGADVVAQVRVLAAACTAAAGGEGEPRTVTLQVALQVLKAEKGPVKDHDVVLVTRQVKLPTGPGPRSYGYMAEIRRFPFTPGVRGDVALRWDRERRCYVGVAGWVAEPNGAAIPSEPGKVFAAGDAGERK